MAAVLRGTQEDLRAGHRASVPAAGVVVRGKPAIPLLGGPIPRHRRSIAIQGRRVSHTRCVGPSLGALVASMDAAIANLPRRVVYAPIPSGRQVAIAGRLEGVGRNLVGVGRGRGLVGIHCGLVAVSAAYVPIGVGGPPTGLVRRGRGLCDPIYGRWIRHDEPPPS